MEEEEKNAIEKVELAGEKSAVEEKAKLVDEEAESQLNRTQVIDLILSKTKHLLEEKEEDDLDEVKMAEESFKTVKKKIVTEEKEIRKKEKVAKNIKADLKNIAEKVAQQGKAESEKVAAAEEKTKAISSEVWRAMKSDVMSSQVMSSQVIISEVMISVCHSERVCPSVGPSVHQ